MQKFVQVTHSLTIVAARHADAVYPTVSSKQRDKKYFEKKYLWRLQL